MTSMQLVVPVRLSMRSARIDQINRLYLGYNNKNYSCRELAFGGRLDRYQFLIARIIAGGELGAIFVSGIALGRFCFG